MKSKKRPWGEGPEEKEHTNVERAAWISTFEEALAKAIVQIVFFTPNRAGFSSGQLPKGIESQHRTILNAGKEPANGRDCFRNGK